MSGFSDAKARDAEACLETIEAIHIDLKEKCKRVEKSLDDEHELLFSTVRSATSLATDVANLEQAVAQLKAHESDEAVEAITELMAAKVSQSDSGAPLITDLFDRLSEIEKIQASAHDSSAKVEMELDGTLKDASRLVQRVHALRK